jgi:hypothetical protein
LLFPPSILQELALNRKTLELQGVIRKDVLCQTDNYEESAREPHLNSHQHSGQQSIKLATAASSQAPVRPIAIKVPAFQMLSQERATDFAGPPKWKRELMAKARA